MEKKFKVEWIVENGYPHYKIEDLLNGTEIHCDENELNEILYELIGA